MDSVATWNARDMTDHQRREIAQLLCKIWPKPGRTVETRVATMTEAAAAYEGPDETQPRSFVILEAGRVIAHAAIICRTIGSEAGDITVAGLAQVCSRPELRGRGLGEKVVRAALQPVDEAAFPVALFQTSNVVQAFYEKLGARRIHNRFVNSLADEPEENPWDDPVHMIYPKEAAWPEGTIDLRGPRY